MKTYTTHTTPTEQVETVQVISLTYAIITTVLGIMWLVMPSDDLSLYIVVSSIAFFWLIFANVVTTKRRVFEW